MKLPPKEKRNLEQIKEHYEIERQLSDILRKANQKERGSLYNSLYDELFRRVPHHPQLKRKGDSGLNEKLINQKLALINRFLKPESVFMEIGAGDCSLSIKVAEGIKKVYALDVSKEIAGGKILPGNCELIISDGCSIPVPEKSIDIAYSHQLMEHLHPDDSKIQLAKIYNALADKGKYICITPSRICGPHDISKYFDEVATGFHLKEYTYVELSELFKNAGFSKIGAFIGGRGKYFKFPISLIILSEKILSVVPNFLRKKIVKSFAFKALLGVNIIGTK